MKLKVLSLVAGAIALTLTATSFAVNAQTASPSPVLLAETPHGRWKDLNLSSLQESQIKDIHQQTWQQIENTVFTPDQKAQFEAAKQARKAAWQARQAQGQTGQQTGQHRHHRHRGGIFAKLNLSQAQKDQIKSLEKSERQQIKSVLTPAQQQQIHQWRKNHQ
ncbi:P pilus assembly/Cpx signaling pathway, periplasmic inhibitor/zinc-resistance associated protein [Nostoc sp.]|uniref:P pilus assembly/Cpx signaling pathway, periplasmic inhibitor/zinc-resistance associated protein n=1 Tax=Nostoc sp. TaxID=1180 RepID=UPI002FF78DD9